MIENVRPAASVTFPQPNLYVDPKYREFCQQHEIDGMGAVELDDRIHRVFPTGAVVRVDIGGWYAPPEDPYALADWKLKHAAGWLKTTVAEFDECKRQALANPEGFDWLPDLRRLKDAVLRARVRYRECHETFEVACGRGRARQAEWERQTQEMQRGRQAHQARISHAISAVCEISIDEDPSQNGDE